MEPRTRLLITPDILRQLKAGWECPNNSQDVKMVWAACCLCFFAFLRIGEAVSPGEGHFDPKVHFGINDIALGDICHPSALEIHTKTDPFQKGVRLFVGRTGTDLCPVAAMLGYLLLRGTHTGPLLIYEDRHHLTRRPAL